MERVVNFGSVVGKFSGLVEGDDGDESGCRDFSRIVGEDSVNLLPDLKFVYIESYGAQRCTEIRVSISFPEQHKSILCHMSAINYQVPACPYTYQ